MSQIQIKAEVLKDGKVKLSTSDRKIRSKTVLPNSAQELYAEFRAYKTWILLTKQANSIDVSMPNMYRTFMDSRAAALPPVPPVISMADVKIFCSICGKAFTEANPAQQKHSAHHNCYDNANKYETNMVEPLVGWKGWQMEKPSIRLNSGDVKAHPRLKSNYSHQWLPDVATVAACGNLMGIQKQPCAFIPNENHTCGIYAANEKSAAHGGIQGQVYGWGRYVRGVDGWRSEFAYPKNFYIREDQMEFFDALKEYHVPIYVMQPMRMYDPVEDGFEGEDAHEYRPDEEDGSSGAGEVTDPSEEDDEACEDEESED